MLKIHARFNSLNMFYYMYIYIYIFVCIVNTRVSSETCYVNISKSFGIMCLT